MATHNFTGRVTRLYVRREGLFVRLDIAANQQPLDNYFRLPLDHQNYNSLYSIALAASINRYNLWIRTTVDIDPGERAEVEYMVVDW
ncbi:MAG: hypothetical protein LC749_17130 [Actinobacteria bacterium]|nr:hypothetical protein [Actinomycetota bacterium]